MHEKSEVLPRLLRRLRIAPGSLEAATASSAFAEAMELARPEAFRKRLDIPEFLELFAPHAQASAHLMSRLEDAAEVWVLAATIGCGLEGRASELFAAGEAFRGYVLDWFGDWLVDQALRREIAAVRELPGRFTRRLSPGYKDFPLAAQGPIVRLAGSALGLTVTGAFALHPRKTVTAVLGRGA